MIWVAQALFIMGIFFGALGTFGVLRFPDVYTRLQAASKCGTTAVFSILLGCILLTGFSAMTGKIIAIALFFLVTSPVSAHIIGHCAWQREVPPWRKPRKDRQLSEE
jgi:multicomponent Na+:H+ antiporter subunit G